MPVSKLITCREYDYVSYNSLGPVRQREQVLRRLERLADRLSIPMFRFYRTELQVRQYVGVVKAGGVTLQVLPKIYDREDENLGFLIFLLRYTRRLRLKQSRLSDYDKLQGSFLEIWIRHFASELNRLLRTQPKHRYVEIEERTQFLRGKLLTERELAGTNTLTARHACRYEIFTPDHLLNQALKFCNNLLLRQAETPSTRALLEENAARLAEVSDRRVMSADLDRVHPNRLDTEYEPLLGMCRLLLEGYSPGMEAGEVEQLAFVFDMNVLFEEFVAEFLRRHKDGIELDGGRRLKRVARQQVLGKLFGEFNMEVDLVLEDSEGEKFLVDTKYKVLDFQQRHAGLSQADFYQMYAYGQAGDAHYDEVFLLFPMTEPPVDKTFEQRGGITLYVRQFDPRRIYDPQSGRLDVGATVEELGRALARRQPAAQARDVTTSNRMAHPNGATQTTQESEAGEA